MRFGSKCLYHLRTLMRRAYVSVCECGCASVRVCVCVYACACAWVGELVLMVVRVGVADGV